jgi:hypothetical protein
MSIFGYGHICVFSPTNVFVLTIITFRLIMWTCKYQIPPELPLLSSQVHFHSKSITTFLANCLVIIFVCKNRSKNAL